MVSRCGNSGRQTFCNHSLYRVPVFHVIKNQELIIISQVTNISLSKVVDSPYQIRQISGTPELDASIDELSKNIQMAGLINPITVRLIATGNYEIVAGHRRAAAARRAGMNAIPAVVADDVDDAKAEEILVSENLFRQDLTAIEEGQTVAQLLKSRSIADVARLCNKSERWVYRRANIMNLTPEWQKLAKAYNFSASFCESVAAYEPGIQDAVLKERITEADFDFISVAKETETITGHFEDKFSERMTFNQFVHSFNRQTRELADAPWAEYCPQWCKGCEHRTDAQPGLFDDGDEPRCQNKACYERKLDSFVKEAKPILKAKYGKCETFDGANTWALDCVCDLEDVEDEGERAKYVATICTHDNMKGEIIFVKPPEKPQAKPKKKLVNKADVAYIQAVESMIHGMEYRSEIVPGILTFVAVLGVDPWRAHAAFKAVRTFDQLKEAETLFADYADVYAHIWGILQQKIAMLLKTSKDAVEVKEQRKLAEALASWVLLDAEDVKCVADKIQAGMQ